MEINFFRIFGFIVGCSAATVGTLVLIGVLQGINISIVFLSEVISATLCVLHFWKKIRLHDQ